MRLKQIIEQRDTRAGRAFDFFVQSAIVISLVSFSLETLPDLPREGRFALYCIEVITVSLFTIEYALRLLVSDNPLRFALSVYGLVDLLAILPFYVAVGIDLRAVRAVRLFRVFALFKLTRYTQAINRFARALREVREELLLYLFATALTIYLSSVGIYYFERDAQPEKFASVFHALWWSVVTLTTVGYGDAYPITAGGKLFTAIVLIIGLGIVAVPTGLLASALTRTRETAAAQADGLPLETAGEQ